MLDASSSHKHSAASEELTRMAITLLLDALGCDDATGLSQVDACAVYTLACLGVTYGLQDCRSAPVASLHHLRSWRAGSIHHLVCTSQKALQRQQLMSAT